MAHVALADQEQLPEDLKGISGISVIMARAPEVTRIWRQLDGIFFRESSPLSANLKEQSRRSLAQTVGCRFCNSLGEVSATPEDNREALAVAFAQLLATDHSQITAETFDLLREEFSEEEIVELVAWLCFKFAGNLFGAVMNVEPATEDEVAAYRQRIGVSA